MKTRSRFRAAGLVAALALAALVAVASPAGAAGATPTPLGSAEASPAQQDEVCNIFAFPGPNGEPGLGAFGVYHEWLVQCNVVMPRMGLSGIITIGTTPPMIVASRDVVCTNTSVCNFVVQVNGCVDGVYQGRLGGLLTFPAGNVVPFERVSPPALIFC